MKLTYNWRNGRMEENKKDVEEMLKLIQECIKNDNLVFLATLICKLQKDYEDIAKLSTYGEYLPTWTHKQVLDFITYET